MNRPIYNRLIMNGKPLVGDDLLLYCTQKLKNDSLASWETATLNFIIVWLNDESEVKVRTSGSTGNPKEIRINKQHMTNSALATEKALNLKAGQTALLALSAEYIAGKMMIVRAFVSGLNLIAVEPSGDPFQKITQKIDFTALVPFQLSRILKSDQQVQQLHQINKILIGGGVVDEGLIKKIASFPNEIYASYGMTETCTHIALRRINGQRPDPHFRILPSVKISKDSRSCLVIEAPHLSNEILITNDIVTLISESEFVIRGRIDNIINSGGIKISPETIEAKLNTLIEENYIVSSAPDPDLGEKIILFIESENADLNSLYHLWQKVEGVLLKYEIPKKIEFIKQLPYTHTGKIDRVRMKEFAQKI